MIIDEFFDELRADWDYSGGGTGSYWHILKHAEIGGFDLAAMKRSISASLQEHFKDATYRLDDAGERDLVLDLRDRMRTECMLAPLSLEERQRWQWSDIAPTRNYRQVPRSDDPDLRANSDQNQAIASNLMVYYPEAVRYIRWVRMHNNSLPGFNGGPYDKYIVRQLWSRPFLEDAGCAVLGETSKFYFDWSAVEQIVAPWST